MEVAWGIWRVAWQPAMWYLTAGLIFVVYYRFIGLSAEILKWTDSSRHKGFGKAPTGLATLLALLITWPFGLLVHAFIFAAWFVMWSINHLEDIEL